MSKSPRLRGRTASIHADIACAARTAAVLVAVLACSSQREVNEPEAPPPAVESSEAAPSISPAPPAHGDDRAAARDPSASTGAVGIDPAALNRFVAAVEQLGNAMDTSHTASVEALRAFATALASLPGADMQASGEIQATAERLAGSHETSLEHADLVQHALQTGLSALDARSAPADQRSEYQNAVQELRTALGAVDPAQPLLQQRDEIARAFRAAANTLAIAGNAQAPFTDIQQSAS